MSNPVSILDPYQPGTSVIHQMDAATKTLLALGYILTTSAMPETAWRAFAMLAVILISILLLSELPVGQIIKRSLLALPFLLAAVPIIFTMPGEFWPAHFGSLTVNLSASGALRFLAISIKTELSVLAALLLAASTPMNDTLAALRRLRVPRVLIEAAGLMWRYLFVISEEVVRMMHARAARSSVRPAGKGGGFILWQGRVTGGMAGSLFLRSLERSERVYHAMRARGYNGEIRLMNQTGAVSPNFFLLAAGGLLYACLLALGMLWK